MQIVRILYVLLVGTLILGLQTTRAEEPPANPEAVAAYREGMQLLTAEVAVPDWSKIVPLFEKAAALNLPHADYGLACVTYRRNFEGHGAKAFSYAKRAADRNVFEAKALLISYYTHGYGTPRNPEQAAHIEQELDRDMARQPFVSGAPGTVEASDVQIYEILHFGRCCPPMPDEPPKFQASPPPSPAFELLGNRQAK